MSTVENSASSYLKLSYKYGCLLFAFLLLAGWGMSGFYVVQPDEQGIVTRFGRWTHITQPGLHYHLPMPIEKVIKIKVAKLNRMDIGFSSTHTSSSKEFSIVDIPHESLMLTGDENIIDVDFSVLWLIENAGLYYFKLDNPQSTIKALAESAMREVIGKSKIQYALTDGRKEIEYAVQQIMQRALDSYYSGIKISEVKLQKVDPPQEVIASFRDIQAAEADHIRAQNEAQAYANDVIPKARGQAESIILQAEAYAYDRIRQAEADAKKFQYILKEYSSAPYLTQKRIYMDSMSQILSNKQKIIFHTDHKILPYLDAFKNHQLATKESNE